MTMIKTGDEFQTKRGDTMRVIQYNNAKSVVVEFLKYPYTTTAVAAHVRSGNVKNPIHPSVFGVGYLGVGEYTSTPSDGENNVSPLYRLWVNMMKRCYYAPYISENPTYEGCSVCERWHNFQNFCEDVQHIEGYEEWKKYKIGESSVVMELDKDKKVPGNKMYCPEACTFLTKSQNTPNRRK